MHQSCPDRWRHIPQELHEDEWDKSNTRLHKVYITLVMLAAAFLVSICVHQSRPLPVPSPTPVAVPAPTVIVLTTREVRHLLARLFFPAPTSAALICQWSWWRRTHQYWAGYYHRRRREIADSASFSHARAFPSPRELPALARNSPGSLAGSSPGTFPDPFPGQTSWENSRDFARGALVLVVRSTRKELLSALRLFGPGCSPPGH